MSRRTLTIVGGLAGIAVAMIGLAQITGPRSSVDEHPLGTEVVVGHVDTSAAEAVRTQIALTVLDVRTGTQEELADAGFLLDDEERRATPYYLDARYENRGPNAVARNLGVGLEDTGGDLVPSTLVFGLSDRPFAPCRSVDDGELAPGDAYESCTLVLVPDGVDVARVEFLSDNGPGEEPDFAYWEAE